ncbi:MAG: HAD family hydrolase [bacterium]
MTPERWTTRDDLIRFKPRHDSFVGVDSDGCVFDTMEIKQKQCFHTATVRLWNLGKVEAVARETLEFVNLYSKWRGSNRFISQVKVFELLRERPEVRQAGVEVPLLVSLKKWVNSGVPLSNVHLEQAVEATHDPELRLCLAWSREANDRIAKTVKKIPPFPWAERSLRRVCGQSDTLCVSQTPAEALVREWTENGVMDTVAMIAGQELGTKAEHLRLATGGKYAPGRVLMIGDAPGDLKAARENGALFFPIRPSSADESWALFDREIYGRFLGGTYAGECERRLIVEFEQELPETPPWRNEVV